MQIKLVAPLALLVCCLAAMGQKRIAQFDQQGMRFSNWNAPWVTVDTVLDRTVTRAVIPDTVYFSGRPYPVVEVGPDAFRGCANLEVVTIADSVTQILRGAFLECPSLRVIELRRPRPPHIGVHPFYRGEWYEVFERYHTLATILVVPPGSEQAYREAPGWCEFKVIQSTWPTGDELKVNELDVRINQLESELKRTLQYAEQLQKELDALRRARGQ